MKLAPSGVPGADKLRPLTLTWQWLILRMEYCDLWWDRPEPGNSDELKKRAPRSRPEGFQLLAVGTRLHQNEDSQVVKPRRLDAFRSALPNAVCFLKSQLPDAPSYRTYAPADGSTGHFDGILTNRPSRSAEPSAFIGTDPGNFLD